MRLRRSGSLSRLKSFPIAAEWPRLAEQKRSVLDDLLRHEVEECPDLRPLVEVRMRKDPEAARKSRLRINDADKVWFCIPNLAGQQGEPKAGLDSQEQSENAIATAGDFTVRSHATQPACWRDLFDRALEPDQPMAAEVVRHRRAADTFQVAAATVDRPDWSDNLRPISDPLLGGPARSAISARPSLR